LADAVAAVKDLKILIAGAVLLAAALSAGCATAPKDPAWITLLDGSKPDTLNDWTQNTEANWRVEDGAVVADSRVGKDSTFLVSKKSYGNVQIRAEVWVTPDTNSGVFFRCADPAKISTKSCYEMNIWDNFRNHYYATGAIALYTLVDPVPKAGYKWSTFDITANGPHLLVFMDGNKTVETTDFTHASGPIALQYGGGVVKWRKVEVRPID
jgi:hypothetical protein